MCVCVRGVCKRTRARRWVGLVISLVFCDDDVFRVFRGMPRAALIVTELGPRATLVRMRAVALAFSPRVSHPSISLRLSSLSSCPVLVQRGATMPCRPQRGRRARALTRAGGWLPRGDNTAIAHARSRAHARTQVRTYTHNTHLGYASYICERCGPSASL